MLETYCKNISPLDWHMNLNMLISNCQVSSAQWYYYKIISMILKLGGGGSGATKVIKCKFLSLFFETLKGPLCILSSRPVHRKIILNIETQIQVKVANSHQVQRYAKFQKKCRDLISPKAHI